jgi:hypothetical protein
MPCSFCRAFFLQFSLLLFHTVIFWETLLAPVKLLYQLFGKIKFLKFLANAILS